MLDIVFFSAEQMNWTDDCCQSSFAAEIREILNFIQLKEIRFYNVEEGWNFVEKGISSGGQRKANTIFLFIWYFVWCNVQSHKYR